MSNDSLRNLQKEIGQFGVGNIGNLRILHSTTWGVFQDGITQAVHSL
jgi:hypothetical protein